KSSLAELDLPAITVEDLAEGDEREVQRPQGRLDKRVGDAGTHGDRQRDADPRRCREHAVRDAEPHEDRGDLRERGAGGSARRDEAGHQTIGGEEAVMADERPELLGEGVEGDRVDEAEQPEEEKARQEVASRRADEPPQRVIPEALKERLVVGVLGLHLSPGKSAAPRTTRGIGSALPPAPCPPPPRSPPPV